MSNNTCATLSVHAHLSEKGIPQFSAILFEKNEQREHPVSITITVTVTVTITITLSINITITLSCFIGTTIIIIIIIRRYRALALSLSLHLYVCASGLQHLPGDTVRFHLNYSEIPRR